VGEGAPEGRPLEHAISADVEAKLVLLLGDQHVSTRKPDPGSTHKVEGGVSTPLSQSAPGPVVVRRISEKIEIDDSALVFLAEARLIPGSSVVVVGSGPDGVRVESDSGEQLVPKDVAQLMWVVPA
jgi:hypothetical protein